MDGKGINLHHFNQLNQHALTTKRKEAVYGNVDSSIICRNPAFCAYGEGPCYLRSEYVNHLGEVVGREKQNDAGIWQMTKARAALNIYNSPHLHAQRCS
jgi:hypothetical protein